MTTLADYQVDAMMKKVTDYKKIASIINNMRKINVTEEELVKAVEDSSSINIYALRICDEGDIYYCSLPATVHLLEPSVFEKIIFYIRHKYEYSQEDAHELIQAVCRSLKDLSFFKVNAK